MSGDAGAMLPRVLGVLRDLVGAAQTRCDAGHNQDCEYAVQIEDLGPDEADVIDEATECDCGHVELRREVEAVRASGVLG